VSSLTLKTPRVFAPLLEPSRYKGSHGGRGSGKSHFFAEMLLERAILKRGLRGVCIREVQKTLAQSNKKLLEDKIAEHRLDREGFKPWNDCIETPGDGIILFQGMQNHTAESIKSLEGIDVADIEEAQTLSDHSLTLLRPTIRAAGSEIWGRWNPRRKKDPIDVFLRQNKPANAIVVEANWRDNPWFPPELNEERLLDLEKYPDRYDHVWEGGYVTVFEGAYYAKWLAKAKAEARITELARDSLAEVRAYFDLGGSGAVSDATAIWIVQFVGMKILLLDYIEGVGQVLGYYAGELRARGWQDALCVLPHDASQIHADNPTGVNYAAQLKQAGFRTRIVPNAGKGAAMLRVEAGRRWFDRMWFNTSKDAAGMDRTEAGREALGAYHEKRSTDERDVGLGPNHDWSSHGADAFGLMALDYKEPSDRIAGRPSHYAASGAILG
jgi:phage terminase large subunit